KTADTDLWLLPVDGDRKPHPYLEAPFNQMNGQFSPDGHWVAYSSNESGRFEVYIRPFPDASGGVLQVSTTGAANPLWRGDGKELFYLTLDRKLRAVDVKPNGPVMQLGGQHELFATQAESAQAHHRAYTATADGQRFLISSFPGPSSAPVTP